MRKIAVFSRFQSIRTAMLFSFSILIVPALLIFLFISISYTKETVLNNSTEYTIQLMERMNADIDSYITYMANISEIVSNNKDVTDYFFSDVSNSRRFDLKTRIYSQFSTLKNARNDIYNIGVLSDDDYILNNGMNKLNPYADVDSLDWYQETLRRPGEIVLSSSHVQNIVLNDYKWVVTLSRGIRNPVTNQVECVFFVDLNYSVINNLCKKISLGNNGYVYILDENGNIIYHPKQQLLYSGIRTEWIQEILKSEENSFITGEGEGRRLYTKSRSTLTNWTIVGVAYLNEMMGNRDVTQFSYAVTSLVLFTVALVLSVFLSGQITRPIRQLQLSMKEVEKGNFKVRIPEPADHNEIGNLSRSFLLMTREIEHLVQQNVEEQTAKRKSELKALQSQINPHFLYNTLDSIIWMAEGGKNREVVQMTASLARLLRQSISNEEEMIPIHKEVDYVRQYLTIQKMRYKDKLEFEIDVSGDILSCFIVKLSLQPLIENAIYHGIKYKDTKGMIRLTGRKEENRICLYVIDNGQGMTNDQVEHIFDEREENHGNGVGVRNVQNRLQLFYGKEYGLRYESRLGEGTTVTVIIPDRECGGA